MNSSVPRKPRFDAKTRVTFRSDTAIRDGVIVNLHEDGAAVEIKSAFDEATEVTFVLAETHVRARIVWRNGKQMGLSFVEPIPSDLVAAEHNKVPAWITF